MGNVRLSGKQVGSQASRLVTRRLAWIQHVCISINAVPGDISDVCPIDAGYLHLRQVNACHHFSNRGRYGFFDGNLRCRKLGGHLSKFNNEQERMAIVNVIKSSRGNTVNSG